MPTESFEFEGETYVIGHRVFRGKNVRNMKAILRAENIKLAGVFMDPVKDNPASAAMVAERLFDKCQVTYSDALFSIADPSVLPMLVYDCVDKIRDRDDGLDFAQYVVDEYPHIIELGYKFVLASGEDRIKNFFGLLATLSGAKKEANKAATTQEDGKQPPKPTQQKHSDS